MDVQSGGASRRAANQSHRQERERAPPRGEGAAEGVALGPHTAARSTQGLIRRSAGASAPLVNLLELNSDVEVQEHAAFALMEITRSNPDNQGIVVDNAGIGSLANLMKQSQHVQVKAEVAGAIASSGPGAVRAAKAATVLFAPLQILVGVTGLGLDPDEPVIGQVLAIQNLNLGMLLGLFASAGSLARIVGRRVE